MAKNPLGKTRDRDNPYAVFVVVWPDIGKVTHRLLKTYQLVKNERKNEYARWFTCSTSPATSSHGDMGDIYAREMTTGATLQYASPEFIKAYESCLFENTATGETTFLWEPPEHLQEGLTPSLDS